MSMPIVAIGLSLVQGVMQYSAQAGAAAASRRYAEQQQELINANAIRSYDALAERQMQEHTAAANDIHDVRRDAAKAAARAVVAAGEAGVSGASVQGLLRDFAYRESNFVGRRQQQYDWTTQQMMRQREAIYLNAQSETNTNLSQITPRPSFLDAGLRILADGVGTYQRYYRPGSRDLSGNGVVG